VCVCVYVCVGYIFDLGAVMPQLTCNSRI